MIFDRIIIIIIIIIPALSKLNW